MCSFICCPYEFGLCVFVVGACLGSLWGDVAFKLVDGEEKAHSVVLMAASDVFESMLRSHLKEAVICREVVRVPAKNHWSGSRFETKFQC